VPLSYFCFDSSLNYDFPAGFSSFPFLFAVTVEVQMPRKEKQNKPPWHAIEVFGHSSKLKH
jgi:hypothetical protein